MENFANKVAHTPVIGIFSAFVKDWIPLIDEYYYCWCSRSRSRTRHLADMLFSRYCTLVIVFGVTMFFALYSYMCTIMFCSEFSRQTCLRSCITDCACFYSDAESHLLPEKKFLPRPCRSIAGAFICRALPTASVFSDAAVEHSIVFCQTIRRRPPVRPPNAI